MSISSSLFHFEKTEIDFVGGKSENAKSISWNCWNLIYWVQLANYLLFLEQFKGKKIRMPNRPSEGITIHAFCVILELICGYNSQYIGMPYTALARQAWIYCDILDTLCRLRFPSWIPEIYWGWLHSLGSSQFKRFPASFF